MKVVLVLENVERHLVRCLGVFWPAKPAAASGLFFQHYDVYGNFEALAKGDENRLVDVGCRGLPGGNLLSLLRQRKKAKKGDPRFIAPQKRGVPCVTRNDGPLRNSGSWYRRTRGSGPHSPSDSPRGKPPSLLRYSATLIGIESHVGHFFPEVRLRVVLSAIVLGLALVGCGSTPKKIDPPKQSTASPSKPGAYYLDDGPGDSPLPNLDKIPNAVPKVEKLHSGANRTYTVFGKTYVPNVSSEPFRQQGIGSWYGRKFHGQKTSIGETYDMYAMTAAHPTLPLPSYVRVSNPANGKSVVVRVNDRGPFHSERIIDLSYVAAAKLDYVRRGSAMVIVERVFPGDRSDKLPPVATVAPSPVAPIVTPGPIAVVTSPIIPEVGGLYLQLGAFSSMENAEIFRARLARELDWNREPLQVSRKDNLFRVRMGPYKSREEAEAIASQVRLSHDFSPVIQ